MDLIRRLEEFRAQEQALEWEGTFADYFEIVKRQPQVTQLAHARIYNMLMSKGVEVGSRGEPRYNFFADEIFGLERPLQQIVEYFSSGAQRLEVRKRILLLMGPVGGGKSTIVSMLKRGLEQYTRTEAGGVYAIRDCPMHEEPLHLIPESLRADFEREYGIYIEGDLCPRCRYDLDHTYEGHIERVPVRRMVFSEKHRTGIGTFSPSDPKCVTGDTLLLTDLGMVRFDEIQAALHAADDEFTPFVVDVSGRDGREQTSHFYNGGVRPTRRIRTRLGYEIEGSLVHPLLVMRDGQEQWIKLGDLRVGEHVALQRGAGLFGRTTKLPEFADTSVSRGQNRGMTLPIELDADLARLLGYIVAEGSLTDTAMWITNGDRRVLDDSSTICARLFGVRPKEYGKAGTYARSLTISSIRLVRWLEQVCGISRGAANKTMPRVIRAAPQPLVLAFLEGLFWGDGTISARGEMRSNRFKYASASSELARQVQVMLLNVGIVSALYKESIKDKFTAYAVVVQGDGVVSLLELLPGLRAKYTETPAALIARRGRTNFDHVPQMQSTVKAILETIPYGRRGPFTRYHRYASTEAYGRNLTYAALTVLLDDAQQIIPADNTALATLRRHKENSYVWLEVQEISEGCEQVYDLTVPGTHSFCANGFINHNSQDVSELVGSIDLSTIGEVGSESDPRAYRFDGELNIANRGVMEFVEMLKCLAGGSLVFTEHGIRRVGSFAALEHEVDETHPIELRLATANGQEQATYLYRAGLRPTKRVTTRRGYASEGTHEHRVLVVDEAGVQVWRQHDELRAGDWLVLQKGQNLWGADVQIDAPQPRSGAAPIRVPERMSPELARWLGYLTAEGDTQANGTIRFASMEDELRADYCRLTERLFGLKPRLYTKVAQLSSVALLDLLKTLGFQTGAYNKQIPWSILESSRDCLLEFLAGYFAGDGTVGLQGRLSWTTASQALANQLQTVLLNLGIVSNQYTARARATGGAYRDYWTIIVGGEDADRLAQVMPLLPVRKRLLYQQRAGAQPRSSRTDVIPNTAGYWTVISNELQKAAKVHAHAIGGPGYRVREGAWQILGEDYTNLHMLRTGTNNCTRGMATKILSKLESWVETPVGLSTMLNPALFYDQIVTIEDSEADCWDFHVPGSNTFIANGFVNHNCDERFLYVLLTLSQEQNIKTGRFSMIYADEVIVSHTNENEYISFAGNKKSEALQDRMILIRVPYNLRVSDEVRIYEKLLKQSALQKVHIAPHTLRVASIFAVLTRLESSKKAGMSLMKKLRLYDGEDVEDFKSKDIKELQDEGVREGMEGISPRYIINRLSGALVRDGITCINPIDALRALRDGLEQHTSITREQRTHYLNLIAEARREYDELAKKEVQRAFVYSYEEAARTLLNNYLDNVEAFCNKQKLRDPITEEEVEPDEQLMRSIEEQIGVTENAKKAFREEILIRLSSLARRGQQFDYTSHERLKEAIEKKLFADLRDVVKITTSARTPDPEQVRKINEVVDRLVSGHGYCNVCANALLTYVGSLLNR